MKPTLGDEELASIFAALDVNQSGEIDLTEFIAATCMALERECQIDLARQSFMQVDKSGKGLVRNEDLRHFLMTEVSEDIRAQLTTHDLETEITSMDLDGDGHISVEEYSTALTRNE